MADRRWRPDGGALPVESSMIDTAESVKLQGLDSVPLRNFDPEAEPLTTAQRLDILDQALAVIDDLFVHLPLKRAMHAVHPVQRLKLLGYRAEVRGA